LHRQLYFLLGYECFLFYEAARVHPFRASDAA
jgi:hypothetical protein